MKLYKSPLTKKLKKIFRMSMENNVLVHHAANYKMDNCFLYFPKESFKDKSVIKKLLDNGTIFPVPDDEVINYVDCCVCDDANLNPGR